VDGAYPSVGHRDLRVLHGFRKINKRCIFKPNQLPKKKSPISNCSPFSTVGKSPKSQGPWKKPSSWPNRVVTMRECLRIPVNLLSLFAALTDAAARPSRLGMNLWAWCSISIIFFCFSTLILVIPYSTFSKPIQHFETTNSTLWEN